MMNKNVIDRLKTAAGYQRQAFRALLPEGMEGHLDVIGQEMKAMFAELLVGVMSECRENVTRVRTENCEKPRQGSAASDMADAKVKRVTIE